MFFTVYKLDGRLEELGGLRYCGMQDIFPFNAYDDIRSKDEVVQLPAVKGENFTINKNDTLIGKDRYIWAEKKVVLPIEREGFELIARFDFGEVDEGFAKGTETLLYVDDIPYQGVDVHHDEVFFNNSYSGKEVDLKLLVWTGLHLEPLTYARNAQVGYIHTATDELFHIGRAITRTYKLLEDTNPIKEKILKALNDTFMKIDIYEEKEVLYKQVEEAHGKLLEDLESIGKNHDVTVYCVGHAHIDVGWLWRIKHTKEKCLRSFSTVLRYMEQHDDYYFIQSQPQLYKYVKENFPEFYEKMRAKVEEGKFEANGGMWVEADCNIGSGESLVRQFLYGHKFFKDEFGVKSNCLWLPDVFGYSWALPQILKQCNIDTFMTTKISWNEYNKIPHDTFNWRGMDGTEILTHFITTPNECNPDYYSYFTYNGQIEPGTVNGVWDNYKDKSLTEDVIISFGLGDGGGGPTREMLMSRKAIDKVPGMPNVKNITAGEYFNKLHENVDKSEAYKHTWVGELYFENHRGTYTSQGYNKLMNRKLEYYTTQVETLGVLANLLGVEYSKEQIDKVWELILVNQFHDIIPGSSITEVYEDSTKDYAHCVELLDEVKAIEKSAIIDEKEDSYSFFNFTAFERKDVVFISEERQGRFTDKDGEILKADKIQGGYKVYVTLTPMAFTTVTFVKGQQVINEAEFTVNLDTKSVETPYYSIEFNEEGLITKLFDKENNRNVLNGFGNRLTAYEDIPMQFDAWNIDLDHINKYEVVKDLKKFEVNSIGSLELELSLQFKYRKSTINQAIKLYSNNRRIDFVTNVDWHETHRLLKTCFDVDVMATKATYDIQFGNIERNTHYSTSWDHAKFEVVAHKWADLSENGYGVSLLNNCKYGHSIHDTLMSISLIKCATWPDEKADQGEHNFTYAILPHAGTWQEGGVQKQGEFLNQDLYVFNGEAKESGRSLIKLSAENISIDAVKIAEDGQGLIVRIHEYMGRRCNFNIGSDFEIEEYTPVNMIEESIGNTMNSSRIEDSIKPYEIKNYRVKLKTII